MHSQQPNAAETIYQAACLNAQFPHRRGRALQLLALAIQNGYGANDFEEDTDLDSLREMPGYQAIKKTIWLSSSLRGKRNRKPETPEFFTPEGE